MPSIKTREHEPFEVALRRFKRICEKAGLISEMRRHEFYEKPTWKKKRLAAQAKKRLMKKIYREKVMPARANTPKKTKKTFSRD